MVEGFDEVNTLVDGTSTGAVWERTSPSKMIPPGRSWAYHISQLQCFFSQGFYQHPMLFLFLFTLGLNFSGYRSFWRDYVLGRVRALRLRDFTVRQCMFLRLLARDTSNQEVAFKP